MRKLEAARIRMAAQQAERLRQAFRRTVDVDAVVEAFYASVGDGEISTQQARDWTNIHVVPDPQPLMDVLPRLYANGAVMGDQAALAAVGRATGLKKADATLEEMLAAMSIDWDTWKPGDKVTAALVKPSGALRALLEERGVTINGLNATTLNRIGTRLADSISQGLPQKDTARALNEILNDPKRAEMVAATELSRAYSASSMQRYRDSGMSGKSWLLAWGDACATCSDNAGQGVLQLDAEFDSGDIAPPAHPRCLCTIAPRVLLDEELPQPAAPTAPARAPWVQDSISPDIYRRQAADGTELVFDQRLNKHFTEQHLADLRDTLAELQDYKPVQGVVTVDGTPAYFKKHKRVLAYHLGDRLGQNSTIVLNSENMVRQIELVKNPWNTTFHPPDWYQNPIRGTIVHEYGHALDMRFVTDYAYSPGWWRDEVKWKQKIGPYLVRFLSDYGKKNHAEAFAEAFEDWFTSKGTTTNKATQAIADLAGWGIP